MNRQDFLHGILVASACIAALAASSQARKLDEAEITRLSEAYKYRIDIDKKVLAQTRKWTHGVGILHADWIENPDGKSIDLQGNVLFPQYGYTSLQRYCGGLFVMTVQGRSGVVRTDGQRLTPFEYDRFDFQHVTDGLLLAVKEAEAQTDVYTTEGRLLQSVTDAVETYASYDTLSNLVTIEYVDRHQQPHVERLFPDGTAPASGGEHAAMQPLPTDQVVTDVVTLFTHGWMQMGLSCMHMKKEPKAVFCLEYFADYDRQRMPFHDSFFSIKYYNALLQAYVGTEQYQKVIDIVRGSDPYFQLLPFKFDAAAGRLEMDETYPMADALCPHIAADLNGLNESYQLALHADEAKAIKEQQRAERRERNAQLWGAALGMAMVGAANIFMDRHSTPSATKAASAPRKGVSSTSASTSGGDSSEPEFEDVEEHEKCTVCDGLGHCKYCDGKGTKVYTNQVKVCAACNGHPKCSACDGRGYKIRKTVRKK